MGWVFRFGWGSLGIFSLRHLGPHPLATFRHFGLFLPFVSRCGLVPSAFLFGFLVVPRSWGRPGALCTVPGLFWPLFAFVASSVRLPFLEVFIASFFGLFWFPVPVWVVFLSVLPL